jgi:hypothetical protein
MKTLLLSLFTLSFFTLSAQYDLKLKINTVTGQFKYSEGDTMKTVEGSKIKVLRTQGEDLLITGDGVILEIRFPESIHISETLVFNMDSAPANYMIFEYRIEDNEVKLVEVDNYAVRSRMNWIRSKFEPYE